MDKKIIYIKQSTITKLLVLVFACVISVSAHSQVRTGSKQTNTKANQEVRSIKAEARYIQSISNRSQQLRKQGKYRHAARLEAMAKKRTLNLKRRLNNWRNTFGVRPLFRHRTPIAQKDNDKDGIRDCPLVKILFVKGQHWICVLERADRTSCIYSCTSFSGIKF